MHNKNQKAAILLNEYGKCTRSHPHEEWEDCLVDMLLDVKNNHDLLWDMDRKIIAGLNEEIEHLKYELAVIGDMAVVDFDDPVVGMVDKIIPETPKTYIQRRRAELTQYDNMKKDVIKLQNRVKELERNNMNE